MKYLRQFENHTEYSSYVGDLDLPNVSYCTQENEVHYIESLLVPIDPTDPSLSQPI